MPIHIPYPKSRFYSVRGTTTKKNSLLNQDILGILNILYTFPTPPKT